MTLSGFLNIDKPGGITSHDVVAAVKRAIRQRDGQKVRVGHAGTLDPLATGVLVVCLGSATRLSEYVMASRKTYLARVRLGISTDSYDSDGTVTGRADCAHLTPDDVIAALPALAGEVAQIPPMYSAVKVGGKKLYELARRGETVERQARPVTIHALEAVEIDLPELTLHVTCSAGTYIRTLAHDLGAALGVGAHLTALRRVASGAFHIDDATPLDDLLTRADWSGVLISPADALADWLTVPLDSAACLDVKQGRRIPNRHACATGTLARALTPDGELVGILRAVGDQWQPHKIFA